MKKIVVAILLSLVFWACGDENIAKAGSGRGTMKVLAEGERVKDVPCDSSNMGELVYYTDFQMVFYCTGENWKSANGMDGVNGKNGEKGDDGFGEHCSISPVENAVFLICGADSISIKLNQGCSLEKSSDGKTTVVCGQNSVPVFDGEDGKKGSGCSVEEIEDGYKVVCEGDSVGVVAHGRGNECSATDNDSLVLLKCPNGDISSVDTLYKAYCMGKPFNPKKFSCVAGQLLSLEISANPLETNKGDKDESEFDPSKNTLVDLRDGQVYKTVVLGSKIWMKENLNYAYTQGTSTLDSSSFCYNNDPTFCAKYGRLYLWSAVVDSVGLFSDDGKDCGDSVSCHLSSMESEKMVRGVCPKGWHVSTADDFMELMETFGRIEERGTLDYAYYSQRGGNIMSDGDWPIFETVREKNEGYEPDCGFSARPAGVLYGDMTYLGVNAYVGFWTSQELRSDIAYAINLIDSYVTGLVEFFGGYKNYGRYVRCIKD